MMFLDSIESLLGDEPISLVGESDNSYCSRFAIDSTDGTNS